VRNRLNLFVAITALIASVVVSIIARSWFGKPAETDTLQTTAACCVSQNRATAAPGALAAPAAPLSGAVITLTRFGFEPGRMAVQAGRCLLGVQNRSSTEDITLRLSTQSGERLISVRFPSGRRHWEKVFNLAPGAYVLTEADHPQWVFQLTVTPPDQAFR
jgi:hypothetical protein